MARPATPTDLTANPGTGGRTKKTGKKVAAAKKKAASKKKAKTS